ncbi:UNVERIFIED_CONTAM: hypothetical protein Slati_2175300 [Sesamum latifolium]
MEASRAADDGLHDQDGPVPTVVLLGSQISFVPNLRAYRGMLGRACCRLPTATLRCVVGRRALACAPGHCVRNGRVSGDWRVWACWIPARAATTSPASRLSRRPKRHLALAEVGFLCCIPIARAFCCPERPVSALRRSSRGCGAGWTSKHTLCPTSRARLHVLGLLAHGVVARSLGCGTHCGHEARGLCLPRKTSVLRFVRTTPVAVLGSSHAGDGVGEECYLVDPASSHMLVSRLSHACDFGPITLAFGIGVMINRDSRGHSYFIVRGEILGFMKDEQLRKHLPRMFSLIKNESWGLEDDQIPS